METIQDYIQSVRILLQDQMEPYRYSDDEMVLALNLAFSEAYRLRPDMFVLSPVLPNYLGKPMATKVMVPTGYQSAFMYYIAGHIQLRDGEETQDSRAGVFLTKFTSQLLTTAA